LGGISSRRAVKGFAYGTFKRGRLVSYAASPEFLEDLAIVRGVSTAPDERGKGYSKSVCSALVKRLLDEGKEVMLYVSRDNAAALNVYREIGFKETGHRFLGFTARRKD
jgi:predicted GNAT family acetyltransferase